MCADHPQDLEHETRIASGDDVRAIGWIEPEWQFPTGSVSSTFRAALAAHLAGAQPRRIDAFYTCARPSCAFCRDRVYISDDRHMLVTDGHSLFVAPALIGHFIDEHQYRPPDEFVRAVEARPAGWRNRLGLLRHARHGAVWSYLVGQLVFQPIGGLFSLIGPRQAA